MKRVLIADDSPEFVHNAEQYLKRHGWAIDVAPDGAAAMKKLQEDLVKSAGERLDAILLDRVMPGISGDEILKWIHECPELESMCVVMVTGYSNVPTAIESLRLGAFAYLQKPVELPDLAATLAAGIVWQQMRAVRRELVVSPSLSKVFNATRQWMASALQPVFLDLMLAREDGTVTSAMCSGPATKGKQPAFLKQVIETGKMLSAAGDEEIRLLDAINPETKSIVVLPLRVEGRVIGAIDIEFDREDAFGSQWARVFEDLGDICGLAAAAEQASQRAIEAERAQVEHQRLLYREFRHNLATHAQIISMQTRELEEKTYPLLVQTTSPDAVAELKRRIEIVRANADAINVVTADLKDLSSVPKLEKEPFDLSQLVRRLVEEMTDEFQRLEIEVLVDAPDRIEVQADKIWIDHSVRCLLRNAADAIEDFRKQSPDDQEHGGQIKVRCYSDGPMATVAVSDNGIGFDPEQKDALFLPLFTTKSRTGAAVDDKPARGANRVAQLLSVFEKSIPQEGIQRIQDSHGPFEILLRESASGGADMWVRRADAESAGANPDISLTHVPAIEAGNRGIGLYSARRVLAAHGGTITAYSAGLCQGATFIMCLRLQTEGSP